MRASRGRGGWLGSWAGTGWTLEVPEAGRMSLKGASS